MAVHTSPVATFGLTHLALHVKNPARAFQFYQRVFGMVAVYRKRDFIQAQTPGARDVLVFERSASAAGRSGDIVHFGFRLTHPAAIARAVASVKRARGTLLEAGEFVPGEPYAFVRDPDGYTVEIWYELPTAVDPQPRRRAPRTVTRRGDRTDPPRSRRDRRP